MENNNLTRDSAILLQSFFKHLDRQMKVTKKNQQISVPRLSIIEYLIEEGPQSLKSLADYRKVRAATMSCLVACLVDDGLVLRANAKHDKRSKLFIVTNKGKTLADAQAEQDISVLEKAIENLTKQEQLMLKPSIQLLQKIVNYS